MENLAFGLGVAILLLGRRWHTARIPNTTKATAGWLATVWLFASWMPHAALHLHVGMQPAALLPIEWVFYAGAIAAIAALLWALSNRQGRTSTANGHTTATPSRTTAEHPT